MGRRLGAAAVIVVVIVLAVMVGLWLTFLGHLGSAVGGQPPQTIGQSTPVPGPAPDGPPNHADNRAHLQPGDLTDEQERALAEGAARMEPALTALSTEDRLSVDVVRATLVGLGYPDDDIGTEFRPEEYGGVDRVVVGVSFADGGCVTGALWADQVRLLPMGRIPESGCVPRDTH